jgi:ribonucleotide reductase beta subunit family protein with ferritin-like domain
MSNILNITEKPTSNPIFGGLDGGVFLRSDKIQYPVFKNLYEAGFGKFWTDKMIDFSGDSLGFKTLPPVAQRMFKLNNGYQSIMDSGVVNIYNDLTMCCTNPELAMLYQYIAQNESIHALSYSTGLIEMFGDKATEVIDLVYTDPVIKTRLTSEMDYAEQLNRYDMVSIFKVVVSAYLLEHIKFPFSFFVTFRINNAYSNAINGFSMLLKKIAEDEMDVHYPTNANVIKVMMSTGLVDKEWAHKFISDEAARIEQEEFGWNGYLLQEGSIPGYNKAIGEAFISYQTNKALRDCGVDAPTIKPNDTITWFNHYRDINNQVVAQQEMKSNQYQKGVLKNDLDRFTKDYNATRNTI